MARIRSIHPGLFTDEGFMSVSTEARLLLIGIWTEAYDDGVFDWKPLTLKARLFPVNDTDIVALLSELEAANFLQRFTASGKPYGAVRNFRKFQRPKKPNSSGVLPENLSDYVGIVETSSEPVPNQSGTGGEKSQQMEDGGCSKEDITSTHPASQSAPKRERAPDAIPDEFAATFWPAYPHKVGKPDAEKKFRTARKVASLEEIMAGLNRYVASKPPDRQWCNPATWLHQHRWADQPAATLPFVQNTARPNGGSNAAFQHILNRRAARDAMPAGGFEILPPIGSGH